MSAILPPKAPSLGSALFMAAAVSALLLLVARIVFSLMRLWSCPVTPDVHEKETLFFISKPRGRTLQWNTLPASLPFALTLPEKPSKEVGSGVGVVSHKRSKTLPVISWLPRPGPRFQPPRKYLGASSVTRCPSQHCGRPAPALYESPVPLSMAKIIMSRHVSNSFSSSTMPHVRSTDIPQTEP